jgi:hypothetical protein
MDDRGTAAALPEQEAAPERRVRGFIPAGHEPLHTRARVEAANAAD